MAFRSPFPRFFRPSLAIEQTPHLLLLARWLLICAAVGGLVGSASAAFLVSLDWVTAWHEAYPWISWLLPAGGLLIGASYHYLGQGIVRSYLRGDVLHHGHHEHMAMRHPQCLELIDGPDQIARFLEQNQRLLAQVQLLRESSSAHG